jgi:HEAT repeat protein
VLIAQGRDDGTGMARLREILRTPAAGCATSILVRVGAKAAPALPELIDVIREPPDDFNAAIRQWQAAYALGRIGPSAAAAVPYLFARVREHYPELRRKAAEAIDRIDPTFAARCTVDAATLVEALQDTGGGARPLALRPECER